MKHRPNFRALSAFEAVSRHLSVNAAAVELGVTQSAVSHQLRVLSEMVGEKLIQKSGRGVVLTEAGQRLAEKLQPAFAEIDRSVVSIIGATRDTVRLAVCSSFAPAWLVPRLRRFYALHPQIDLQIMMYARDPELTDSVGDAFVTTLPKDRGYHALLLWAENLVPVLSPRLQSPAELFPNLITTELTPGTAGADWQAHARIAGKNDPEPPNGRWLYASHYVIALEMVRQGLGAALLPDFLVKDDIDSGTLVLMDTTVVPTHEDYHLCIKESRRNEPALEAVERWFKMELAQSRRVDTKFWQQPDIVELPSRIAE